MPEVTDAVCGMTFPEETAEELGALKHMHNGKRYWFCCEKCRSAFVDEPARYVRE